MRRIALAGAAATASTLALAGCGGGSPSAAPGSSSSQRPAAAAGPSATPSTSPRMPVVPRITKVEVLARGLEVPWGLAFLPDGRALVAQRNKGTVSVLAAGSKPKTVGTVPGVQASGESGLLGIAVSKAGTTVFAYLTSTAGDNRVVRMPFDGTKLGKARPILTGIPSGTIHDGGRLLLGRDGTLWVGTGEAGLRDPAQDLSSLGGKILHITATGAVPKDNPDPDSPVWSLGHRNVQGLAFDSRNQLWASEFGQNTWDELNLITKGGNYGWPVVEGKPADADPRFVEPKVTWATSDASPSGVAIVKDVAFVAGLRGERLWAVPLAGATTGTPKALLTGRYGRLRTVAAAPDGTLWLTTSNRDGRGRPVASDDRILRLTLG